LKNHKGSGKLDALASARVRKTLVSGGFELTNYYNQEAMAAPYRSTAATVEQILLIVHQKTSTPGLVGRMLCERGYVLDIRCPREQEELPATMDNHDAVVIFGGPMSANDREMPFIRTELDWIPTALDSHKPFLGICLGAQLLARVLGAIVTPHPENQVDIGYLPVVPTLAGRDYFDRALNFYHWNREGFELPEGAVLLASGETFVNQAFRYGKVAYGLQFHPEMTTDMVDRWTTLGAEHLVCPGVQSRAEQMQNHALYGLSVEVWLQGFLNLWIGSKQLAPTVAS